MYHSCIVLYSCATSLITGHAVGIRGNSAAESAAKDALDSDISDELIPFSDLKPRMNKYSLELR